jgi:thiamine pyrophosphate-dependent acetolactate synthase large subunit-like protein
MLLKKYIVKQKRSNHQLKNLALKDYVDYIDNAVNTIIQSRSFDSSLPEELDDNAIISVDCGSNTIWAVTYQI